MGMNMYMSVINSNGEFVKRNIFEYRDSDWFRELMGDGYTRLYDNFPRESGIPDMVPDEIQKDYGCNWYYAFFHIKVADYYEWFERVRPDIDAAWLSTYEKWLYEKKGIYPKNCYHYLDDECKRNDCHFVEITDPDDWGKWLYDFLRNCEEVSDDDYIVYYFDC